MIGNSKYAELNDLPNPRIDARTIRTLLLRLGYSVEMLTDTSSSEVTEKVNALSAQIKKMPPGSIFLLYYAGHGIEENGVNLLLLSDAVVEDVSVKNGIKISDLIQNLPSPPGGASYFFFDACRTLPNVRAKVGFVREEPPANTMIAFSAGAGSPAADGVPGAGSPFAIALESALMQRGVTGPDLMEIIQLRMPQLIDQQTRVYYSNLSKDLFLNKLATSENDRRTALAFKAGRSGLWEDAYVLARRSAEQGDFDAMLFLVQNLSDNRNAKEKLYNRKEANKWAKAANKSGGRWGQLRYAIYIAEILIRGGRFKKHFGSKEVRVSLEILQKESGNGLPLASAVLGDIELRKIQNGLGSMDSPQRTIRLLTQAFEGGAMVAAVALADAYQEGIGADKDREKAASLYKIAYERGITSAAPYAMSIWSFGEKVRREVDDKVAFDLLKGGAQNGDIASMIGLTYAYYIGLGTQMDRKEAVRWVDALEIEGKKQYTTFTGTLASDLKAIRRGTYIERRE